MKLHPYRAVLLDGDGVLWKSQRPLAGIQDFFTFLDQQDTHWALLTNNNSQTVSTYVKKLTDFGIPVRPQSIFTSSTVTAAYLLKRFGPGSALHVIGMDGLIKTLESAGFHLSCGEELPRGPVAAVVAGMDLDLSYDKVMIAMRLILDGADFVATNTDAFYPRTDGIYPATGMVIGALQGSTSVEPYVVGKPHPAIFKAALKHLNADPDEVLMVGDRLDTDILGANRMGIASAIVLTGITSREEIQHSTIKPDFIFEDIPSLLQALVEVYP